MMQPPEFGIKLDGLDTGTPGSILYGVTPDDKVIPVKVDDQGRLDSSVTLVGDIVVGAFIIEDPISGKKANVVADGTHNALVVTADVLPLPIGAATEATLTEIDSDLTDGTQKTQIVDSLGDVVGATGNALDTNIKTVGGDPIDLGQELMVNSVPVVIASNQSAIPVSVNDFPAVVSVQAATIGGVTINGSTGRTWNLDKVTDSVTSNVVATSASGLTVNGVVQIEDSTGNTLSSTGGSLNVNITGGSTSVEQHTVDSSGDLYAPGTTKGFVSDARIVSSPPSLTAGQFSALNLTTAGRLVTDNSQVVQSVKASSASGLTVNGTVSAVQSGSWTVSLATESIEIGTVDQGNPTGLSNSWPVKLTDGVSTPGITNSNPAGTEQGLIVRNIPSGTQAVSGSVAVNNFPVVQQVLAVAVSGLTINGSTGRTWNLDSSTDSVTSKVLAVSSSGLTINGTVSATQSGTWNINDILGTVSLPTNAAQETGGHLATLDSKFNTLGQKALTNSVPVVIASNQTAIPVSQSGTWTVGLTTESIEIGTVDQGTPNSNANAWPVKITDGISVPGITSSSPIGTEQGLVVRNIPSGIQQVSGTVSVTQPLSILASTSSGITVSQVTNPVSILASASSGLTINGTVSVSNFPSVQNIQAASVTGLTVNGSIGRTWTLNSSTDGVTVSGTVTANAGTGTFTVGQATGTNLHTVVDSGTITANVQALSVGGLTVNGTVGVSNFPSTQQVLAASVSGVTINGAVSITGQPVSIQASTTSGVTVNVSNTPLTILASSVSGLTINGSISVSNFPSVESVQAASVNGITVNGIVTATPTTSSTATLTNVAGSGSNVTILASNSSRKMATVFNDSTHSAAVLYLKFGVTASTSSYSVQVPAGSYYELPTPIFTGEVDGIWSTNTTATARVTEFT